MLIYDQAVLQMAELRYFLFFALPQNCWLLGPFLKPSISFSILFSYYAFAEGENKWLGLALPWAFCSQSVMITDEKNNENRLHHWISAISFL